MTAQSEAHPSTGQPVGPGLRLQFLLARKLALDNVRKLIGVHRARFLVTGAAPISRFSLVCTRSKAHL